MLLSHRLVVAATIVASSIVMSASADVVVGWTIPTAFPTNPPPSGTSFSAGVADQGLNALGSNLSSSHVAVATAYTSPAGNGSQFSFSSNNWAIGDYYEARFSALGFTDLSLSWDQARSSTGPASFELIMSVDGGSNFTTLLASYAVLQSGGGGAPGTWSTAIYNPLYTLGQSLGNLGDNQADVILRFRALVAPGGISGSSRIDSVFVNGTAVPAPGAIVLLGMTGLLGARRRRA
ncbi:MAG: hypothetical protein SGJ09_02230 [Phycisphaerae bacterium]|nr:hypothetical protein [Phycisphaerae bacterium]